MPAQSHWRRLSDAELLEAQFDTTDPERLEGLVEEVPEGETPHVEFAYNLADKSREYVRCSHCHRRNHHRGFVMRTDEGVRFLVGKDCGEKEYGARFEEFTNDFDAARNRADYLRMQRAIRNATPAFKAMLAELRSNAAVRAYAPFIEEFRSLMPRVWGEMILALKNNYGSLKYTEEVRDFEAENRAQDRYESELRDAEVDLVRMSKRDKRLAKYHGRLPKKPKLPIMKRVERVHGTVPTPDLFDANFRPHAVVDSIESAVDEICRTAARDHLTTAQLSELSHAFKEVLERARSLVSRLNKPVEFMQPGNLTMIVEWSKKRGDLGRYQRGVNALSRWGYRKNGWEEEWLALSLPRGYSLPRVSVIDSLELDVRGS